MLRPSPTPTFNVHALPNFHLPQVLLVPNEPTMEWKNLVLKFAANDRVTYLKGDLRSTADLHRVSAQTASSCFILTNRYKTLHDILTTNQKVSVGEARGRHP